MISRNDRFAVPLLGLLLGLSLASCDMPEIRLPKREPTTIPAAEIVAQQEGIVIHDLEWTQRPSTQPIIDFELTVTNQGDLEILQADIRLSCTYVGGGSDESGLLMMAMDDASAFPDKLGNGERRRIKGMAGFPRAEKERIATVTVEIVEVK